MNTLKDRLEELMAEHGLTTQQQLADFAGVSKGLVGQWFNGSTGLGAKPLLAFGKKTRFSTQWLADGTGEKYQSASPGKPIESNATAFAVVETWQDGTPLNDEECEVPFLKEVRLSAGSGAFEASDFNGYKLRFHESSLRRKGINPKDVVCVSADGNSMEPVFPDGATLGVDTSQKHIKDGKIYAINHDGWLRTKILYRLPGNRIRIHSYNEEEHPDEEVDAADIQIIGRVFWWSVLD
ncbi:helix-turn-helix transcriptional regulator [Eikenella sp. Marseille-P7795]|uniref:LexA family transcriptional regulator n=1 Tax=Eikenella sp. Marseille-P7795 TaxID=2866577 RepID=UPI001CE47676|nr:helix-turn-helix transcriptional regulator [Eikenella sp. Marseille-P7795]